jgi:hypothetical protein
LLAEALDYSNHEKGRHSTAALVTAYRGTWHGNLFAMCDQRNPWFKGEGSSPPAIDTSFVNNLIYGFGQVGGIAATVAGLNVVGNRLIQSGTNQSGCFPVTTGNSGHLIFVRDNIDDVKRTSGTQPEWAIVGDDSNGAMNAQGTGGRSLVPFPGLDLVSIRAVAGREAAFEAETLAAVGATLPVRDVHDARMIAMIQARQDHLRNGSPSWLNAVRAGEVTVGLGSDASSGEEPRDTPNLEAGGDPWAVWS